MQLINQPKSRILDCPDGIPRVITLHAWYWDRLDFIIKQTPSTLEEIIATTHEVAATAHERTSQDITKAMQRVLGYEIYNLHKTYIKISEGLANDSKMSLNDQDRWTPPTPIH